MGPVPLTAVAMATNFSSSTSSSVPSAEAMPSVSVARVSFQAAPLVSERRTCSTTSMLPWMRPHTTKVQAAPCQSPPRNITMIRLTAARTPPTRLPPSGM